MGGVLDVQLGAAIPLALTSCALVLSFTGGDASTNPASRLATMDALVHDHAFEIDKSAFRDTADKVKIGNHFYSSKPPVLSFVGALIYKLLHRLTGISFRENRAEAVQVMNWILAGIPHLLLLGYAYAFLRWFVSKPRAFLWTYACLALGNLGLAYATTINNHTPAAVVVFVAFHYAFGLRHGYVDHPRYWVLAGLLAGLAPTLDLGALFISVPLGVYLLTLDWRKTLTYSAAGACLPLAAHFALTWRITGSVVPVYLRPDLYKYSGSYWNAPTGIDALDEPRLTYLWNILLGHHGLLSMTPVLGIALVALVTQLVRRGRYVAEALVIGSALCMLICFYTVSTKNYGGLCAGFRWFIPIVPMLMVFAAQWLSHVRCRAGFAIFLLLMLVGQFHAYAALPHPWEVSSWDRWLASRQQKAQQSSESRSTR
jgi:hypothetical protein